MLSTLATADLPSPTVPSPSPPCLAVVTTCNVSSSTRPPLIGRNTSTSYSPFPKDATRVHPDLFDGDHAKRVNDRAVLHLEIIRGLCRK